MDVGFIGLGNMGAPMAVNLLKAGHSLTVCDLLPTNEKPLLELGAKSVKHPSELARVSEFIFTSLPGPNDMESVSIGSNGILDGILPDSVYIDLTTNRVSLVRSIAQIFKDKGCHMLDAPVSGGVPGAKAGKLAVLASGDEDTYHRSKELLDAIGDKAQYCGAIGSGTICKLAHNAIAYSFMQAIGECLTTAVKAGVEPEIVWRAVKDGAVGRGVPLNVSFPRKVLSGDFNPDFALKLAEKDVALATDLGKEYDVPMPICDLTLRDIRESVKRGWGELDSRVVIRLHEERAGVTLRFQD